MAGESKGHASFTTIAVAAITTIGVIAAAFLQRDGGGKASTTPATVTIAASTVVSSTATATARPAIIVDGFDDRLNVTLPLT